MYSKRSRPGGAGRPTRSDGPGKSASSVSNCTIPSGEAQVIYLANDRIAGELRGDVFQKYIHNRHILHRPPALALDLDLIERLERAGIIRVLIFNNDTGEVFTTALADFRQYGFRVNRGYGEQIALSLGRFSREEPKTSLSLF